jgi:hypothetical protein
MGAYDKNIFLRAGLPELDLRKMLTTTPAPRVPSLLVVCTGIVF